MSFFLFPLIVLVVVALGFLSLSRLRKNKLIVDLNNSEIDSQTILLSPKRPFIVSVFMIFFGIFLLCFFCAGVYPLTIDSFSKPVNYIAFTFIIISLIVIRAGIKLFIKRNHLVQFKTSNKGLTYRPIDWDPSVRSKRPNAFSVFFSNKFSFIGWSEIYFVGSKESFWYGPIITVYPKNGNSFNLPVVYENKQQYEEVLVMLNRYVNNA